MTSGKGVCRTLAAFANGVGGNLLFGVDNSGGVVGVGTEGAGGVGKDTITRWITDLVAPHLDFVVDSVEVDEGRWTLVVRVREGTAPPYGSVRRTRAITSAAGPPPSLRPRTTFAPWREHARRCRHQFGGRTDPECR
ncbi:MAG: AlbA family DNA-binding domain-containing protein [Acidimicrobiales bacterium]